MTKRVKRRPPLVSVVGFLLRPFQWTALAFPFSPSFYLLSLFYPSFLSSINTLLSSASASASAFKNMSLLLDSTTTSSPALLYPPSIELKHDNADGALVFDPVFLQNQPNLPTKFFWPQGDLVHSQEELQEPLVDLGGVLRGDGVATARAVELVQAACLSHGFFQVTNHGVDASLIRAAHDEFDAIFKMPLNRKLRLCRKPGCVSGYSGAHADRYSSKLPWKETFSFAYRGTESQPIVFNYFKSVLGQDFEQTG